VVVPLDPVAVVVGPLDPEVEERPEPSPVPTVDPPVANDSPEQAPKIAAAIKNAQDRPNFTADRFICCILSPLPSRSRDRLQREPHNTRRPKSTMTRGRRPDADC